MRKNIILSMFMFLILCGCSLHVGGVSISGLSPRDTLKPREDINERAAWSFKTGEIDAECDLARVVDETVEWGVNGIKDLIGLIINPFGG